MGLVDFDLSDIGSVFKDIREAITGEAIKDPKKVMQLELKLRELEQAISLGQIQVNMEEAQSSSLFVAGWRPFIGWVGGTALAYSFIVQPMVMWIAELYGKSVTAPTLDMGVLFNLILAMLGFGGLRTYEKLKGVHTK